MPTPEAERLLQEHLDELELHRFSKSNRKLAERVVSLLFQHLIEIGVEDVREVDETHIVSFMAELEKRPITPGTRSTYLCAVKRFFAFLDRRSVILRNPAKHIRLPRVRRLPGFVPTPKQVARLLDTPPAGSAIGLRDRALLETFYGTGVRMGECRGLDVEDIDLQKRTLFVRGGKGRKDRMLPVPRGTLEALERYIRTGRPALQHDPKRRALFLTRRGNRIGTAMLSRLIKDYGAAAGISRLHAHALRHACATHLLQGGADIVHVQRILGHSQVTTTADYVKVYIGDLKKVIENKHPREKQYRRKK